MSQHNPEDTLQSDLDALAEVFEAEDREDRRAEAQRRRDSLAVLLAVPGSDTCAPTLNSTQ